MNRTLIVVATLSLALPFAGMAQSTTRTSSISAPIPEHELQSLIKSAHNSAQYKQLAVYYHQQEAKYRAEAVAEKAERDRRAQVNASLTQKYPRPVDSAQYLYESYSAEADSAALNAQHYDKLAASQNQHDQQLAAASQGKL